MVLDDYAKFWGSIGDDAPCPEIKTWFGGYTGIRYTLICDQKGEHTEHRWVHE